MLSARFTAGSLKKQLIAKPVTEGRPDEVGVMSFKWWETGQNPCPGKGLTPHLD